MRALARVSPQAAAAVLAPFWLRPVRYERPERERSWLAEAERMKIPLGTRSVTGWSWGDPEDPVVLLVHGWEGRGAQLGGFAAPLVEQGFRVVTFDAPGHGSTGGSRASLISFADAILATFRKVGVPHGIVAHSMGGAATLLALKTVDVPRIVLVGTPDASEQLARTVRFLDLPAEVGPALAERIRRQTGLEYEDLVIPVLTAERTGRLLVIHDEGDRFVPLDDGQRITAAWPDGEILRTAGLGHHRILRDPEVILSTARFLAGGVFEESAVA